jgi:hypothetical protein
MWYEPDAWGQKSEPVVASRGGDEAPEVTSAGRADVVPGVAADSLTAILVDLATYAPEAMTWGELDVVITARADTFRAEVTSSAATALAELVAGCAAPPLMSALVEDVDAA